MRVFYKSYSAKDSQASSLDSGCLYGARHAILLLCMEETRTLTFSVCVVVLLCVTLKIIIEREEASGKSLSQNNFISLVSHHF